MADPIPKDVTLNTLHEDLKGGFTDLKTTLISGFRNMPTREESQEMIRLLREANRIQDERLTQLDLRIREQHLESQQVLRGIADGIRALLDGQRLLLDGQRALHEDIRALIARLDALIKGRGDGEPIP